MTRDERRHRIPTSDELEQQGALRPAAEPTSEKRGGLLRFFRASLLRVSDDVAARKHVGSAPAHVPITTHEGRATQHTTEPDRPKTEAPVRPAESIVPRTIRIDPSVKERRGLGRPRDSRGPDGDG
jgi:hypothetical protein